MLTHNLALRINREGDVYHRRQFLQQLGLGAATVTGLSWMDQLRAAAPEMRQQGMACILLFMRGGPSQFETFDPKPGTDTGGPTEVISTSVPGIQIAKGWDQTAKLMKDLAIIRSMTGSEGNHQRAVYQMHTGYAPSGSIKYPSLGSLVCSEIAEATYDLPHYVCVGGGQGQDVSGMGAGFLGMSFAPFVVQDPHRLPLNTELPFGVDSKRLKRRLDLMDKLSQDFAAAGGQARVTDQKSIYQSASSMILSPRLAAFDLNKEKEAARQRYGKTAFGQGCLLARRLVETGVTFVEVGHGNWDTHDDNFNRTAKLAGEVDQGMSALIADLRERGMLEKTLVVWMGEFGRTPNINPRTGRDHYPRAFNVLLAGGGVRGGQVIGATDKFGRQVQDRPIKVNDLFCSFYHALKINPKKENMSGVGRPIKIVDGGTPVMELFSA
jgi:uncharacterized protein (DUF1501 family)